MVSKRWRIPASRRCASAVRCDEEVTIAIGHNGGLLAPGTLSGTKTVTAVNGVATFSDLSIDQPGNGYTLVVNGSGVTGAESATFNIGAL